MKSYILTLLLVCVGMAGCNTATPPPASSAYIDTDRQLYDRLKSEGRIAREWENDQHLMFATVATETVNRRHLFGTSADMKIVEKVYRIPLSKEAMEQAQRERDAKAQDGHVKNMKKQNPGWLTRLSNRKPQGQKPAPTGLKGTLLFSPQTKAAVRYFEKLITSRKQKDWDVLAKLLHEHPTRYAYLMRELTAVITKRENSRFSLLKRSGSTSEAYAPYTAYLMRQVRSDVAFARRSATAWREGWKMSLDDVVERLADPDNASTRRIAIEFLKMEHNNETFGYDWEAIPASPLNQAAIKEWTSWAKTQ